jgi:hypothetical protein
MYSRSRDGGLSWDDPIRISQPNNRDNYAPDVAAMTGDVAYVCWEMTTHVGTALPLAKVQEGSRAWYREDFVLANTDWEYNEDVTLATDVATGLHVSWGARDVSGAGVTVASQVHYLHMGSPTSLSVLPVPVAIADDPINLTNAGPSLALTKRHGAWITWVAHPHDSDLGARELVVVKADRVIDGEPGPDLLVGKRPLPGGTVPMVSATGGINEGVLIAASGLGNPLAPPLFSEACSEHGCYADPVPVVPPGTTGGINASIAADSLGNVYVAWDDGADLWITQRRNSVPGPPDLVLPDRYTHAVIVEFEWTFNDPDAGSSQSAFEIEYAMDELFSEVAGGGVVLGAVGRSSRYTTPEALEEGRWYWRVRTRDQLGLWSQWSPTVTFLADRTPPTGTVIIEEDAEFTYRLNVKLTLNATDNLYAVTSEMSFYISDDPNFPNATLHDYPPLNNLVNHKLTPGEGVKVVFVRFFDATGLSFTAMDSIIFNETPFIIAHTPISTAPAGKPLNVSCEILRGEDATATLFYRRPDDKEFKSMEMESNGTHRWAELPKDAVTLKGLEYYIMAESDMSIVTSPSRSPTEDPYVVDVYETTDEYRPPIYSPTVTLLGAIIIVVLLFAVWYYRIRT